MPLIELGAAGGVSYRRGNGISLEAFTAVYRSCSLGERRPVDRPDLMRAMLDGADLLVTAWDGERIVGLARTLTDFAYVAYVSDLAVDEAWQRRGIGRELVARTRAELGPSCYLTLLAAPGARAYYGRIGFEPHPSAWVLPPRVPWRGEAAGGAKA